MTSVVVGWDWLHTMWQSSVIVLVWIVLRCLNRCWMGSSDSMLLVMWQVVSILLHVGIVGMDLVQVDLVLLNVVLHGLNLVWSHGVEGIDLLWGQRVVVVLKSIVMLTMVIIMVAITVIVMIICMSMVLMVVVAL